VLEESDENVGIEIEVLKDWVRQPGAAPRPGTSTARPGSRFLLNVGRDEIEVRASGASGRGRA